MGGGAFCGWKLVYGVTDCERIERRRKAYGGSVRSLPVCCGGSCFVEWSAAAAEGVTGCEKVD